VLAVALGLRLAGINFGLPYAYHIDERSYVVGALNLGQGEINGYPQQVGLVNVLLAQYGAYYVVGRLTGLFASTQDLAKSYYTNPSLFYLLGRCTSAVLGVATCWLVYLLGKELRNRVVGILAGLLVAVNALHVRESHFTTPDVAQGLGFVVVVLLCVQALRRERPRLLYLASFIAGLTMAFKWASIVLLLPLIFVAWQSGQSQPLRIMAKRWLASGLLVVLGFSICSPQILLFPSPFIEWARRDYVAGSVGGYGGFMIDTVSGWVFYLKASLVGAGVAGIAFALGGFALWVHRLVWQRDRQIAPILLLFVGYFLLMATSRRYFVRYAVPMVPFLSLAAAYAVSWVSERWNARGRGESTVVLAIVALLLVAQPALAAMRINYLWTQEDTRTIAKHWIEQNIPDGAKIATDWMIHGVPLATPDVPSPNSSRTYRVTEVNGLGLSDHPVEFYRDEGFDYLITTSYISNLELVDRQQDVTRDAFYRSLDSALDLVKEFRPYAGDIEPPLIFDHIYGPLTNLGQFDRPGPTLRLYRVSHE